MSKRKRFLIGASVVVSALFITSLWATYKIDAELKSEEAKLRALGIPLTVEELDEKIKALDNNAAEDLDLAVAMLEKAYGKPWWEQVEKDPKLKRQFASEVDPVWEAIERLSEHDQAIWTSDVVERKWLGTLFDLQTAAFHAMEVEIASVNVERAINAIHAGETAAKYGNGAPTMLSAGIASVNGHWTFKPTEKLLAKAAKDKSGLEKISQYFETTPPQFPSAQWSLVGEAVQARRTMKSIGDLRSDQNLNVGPFDRLVAIPAVRKAAEAKLLRAIRETYEAISQNPSHWRQFRDECELIFRRLEADQSVSGRLAYSYYGDRNFASNFADIEAKRNVQRAAALVMLYRVNNGKLPSSLLEAGAELEDCVDGKPLRYSKTATSFKVYSVGLLLLMTTDLMGWITCSR